MSILVTRSSMPSFEEYVEEIRPIFENHYLTNAGPIYKELEKQLVEYLGVPEISLFVNGHMALELTFQALGLDKTGGEVITTPFTFVSTTHAIVRNGLTPVFCDIKPDDFTIDPAKIEVLITDKTVAIVPVHVYGNMCDIEAIEAIAKKHNLKVIYDAAHAFGVTYKGIGAGNFGDATMFSFHATKVFNTIEGGAITLHNHEYRTNLRKIKNFGINGHEDVIMFGANAKMDEFRAAMGICNLRHIDEELDKRRAVAARYDARLKGVPGLQVNEPQKDVVHNAAYYPLCVDAAVFGKSRDELMQKLADNDIFARKYFYPAINEMTCYKGLYRGDTPIACAMSQQIMTLPMYADLALEDVDRICDILLG